MFRWRKRNDGFEWREYVRTTILVRREDRKRKLDDARLAAIDGVKEAAKRGKQASASGAAAFGGALREGAHTFVAALSGSLASASTAVREAMGPLGARTRDALEPALEVLRRPEIDMPLTFIGGVAGLAALSRLPGHGLDREATLALLIAVTLLTLAFAPRFIDGERFGLDTIGFRLRTFLGRIPYMDRLLERLPAMRGGETALKAAALAIAVLAVGTLSWMLLRSHGPAASGSAAASLSGQKLEGRAVALAGDMLRVVGTPVRIAGIEAPEREQTCKGEGNKKWRCGAASMDALSKLIRREAVTCETSGSDDSGFPLAVCRTRAHDVGEELVRGGHAFAAKGLFSKYSSIEGEAKAAKAGLWRGEAERPGEFRAKRWDEAKRAAPEGCPLKGRVAGDARTYVLPW